MSVPIEWRSDRYNVTGTKCPACGKFSMRKYGEGVPCMYCGVKGHVGSNDTRSKGFGLRREMKKEVEANKESAHA